VEVAVEDQELVKVSANDLKCTSWRLVELTHEEPLLADSQVTINFQADQIGGFGGCNNYNSSFRLGEANPFVITLDPVATTKKACPDPIFNPEDVYFTILERVSLWDYDHSKLVLFYVNDQGDYSRMLFAPQGAGKKDQGNSG
jgi:heat shock protein HslJ